MAYYHIDAAQRFLQSLGFDNVYNEQIPVYANSEPPGIPYTDSQAYFRPDFDSPETGSLAFGSGGPDMAEDPEVIIHEYGHAVQYNQVPGFGSDFETPETFALGEGWADWFATAYLEEFSDGFGDLCLGEWVAIGPVTPEGEPREYFRRLDSPKNYPEDLVGLPHDDGEMWSSSLWRIFERIGRADSLRLVVQSNFYLSTDATFESAARAVLRANEELFQGEHTEFITEVFQERGLFPEPINLKWFHVVENAPAAAIRGFGDFTLKLRLDRADSIPSGQNSVEVYVHLLHPRPGELEIFLRSPSGTTIALNRGGTRTLPSGPANYGRVRTPSEPLDGLINEPTAGVWSLQIGNRSESNASLSEWGLRFRGFLRGDANVNGQIEISDAVALLDFFLLGGDLRCMKAADSDDSGSLNIIDAIFVVRLIAGFLHGRGFSLPSGAGWLSPLQRRSGRRGQSWRGRRARHRHFRSREVTLLFQVARLLGSEGTIPVIARKGQMPCEEEFKRSSSWVLRSRCSPARRRSRRILSADTFSPSTKKAGRWIRQRTTSWAASFGNTFRIY